MDVGNIEADIFNLDKNYTVEQLKSSYKKKVLELHPDKSQDLTTSPIFKILTDYYKLLLNKLENESKIIKEKENMRLNEEILIPNQLREKFTIDSFNEKFERCKIRDLYETTGYGTFLSDESNIADMPDKSMIIYKEPLPATSFGVSGYEINPKVDDFSGQNIGHGLHFMDCNTAYLTRKLVDESTVEKRQEYKNLEEFVKDRKEKLGHFQNKNNIEQDQFKRAKYS